MQTPIISRKLQTEYGVIFCLEISRTASSFLVIVGARMGVRATLAQKKSLFFYHFETQSKLCFAVRCMRAFLGIGAVVGLAGAAYWYLTAKVVTVRTRADLHNTSCQIKRSIRLATAHRKRVV